MRLNLFIPCLDAIWPEKLTNALDNVCELVEREMLIFCQQKGILSQTTCPNTPQKNVIIERKHCQLKVSRPLLFQINLPTKLWGEAILTTAYLIKLTYLLPLIVKTLSNFYLRRFPLILTHEIL